MIKIEVSTQGSGHVNKQHGKDSRSLKAECLWRTSCKLHRQKAATVGKECASGISGRVKTRTQDRNSNLKPVSYPWSLLRASAQS